MALVYNASLNDWSISRGDSVNEGNTPPCAVRKKRVKHVLHGILTCLLHPGLLVK